MPGVHGTPGRPCGREHRGVTRPFARALRKRASAAVVQAQQRECNVCDSFVTKQRQGRVDCAVRKACALACNAGAVPVAGGIQEEMLDEGQRSTLLA